MFAKGLKVGGVGEQTTKVTSGKKGERKNKQHLTSHSDPTLGWTRTNYKVMLGGWKVGGEKDVYGSQIRIREKKGTKTVHTPTITKKKRESTYCRETPTGGSLPKTKQCYV